MKRLRVLGITSLFCAGAVFAAAAQAPADLVLLHGRIHTEDSGRRIAQALAVRGNNVVAVGTDADVQAFVGAQTRTVDLRGRVVMPGIVDAHVHPAESAQDLGKCSLQDRMLDPAALRTAIKLCLTDEPVAHPSWFEVIGVNVSQLTLTRREL